MRYSTTTTAPSAEIIRHARAMFGPSGAGLRLTRLGLLDASFSHETGFVTINIEPTVTGNQVMIETRELDDLAMQFIQSLPRPSRMRQLWRRLRS